MMETRYPVGDAGERPAPTPRLRQDDAARGTRDDGDLSSLIAQLGRDASQLAQDELTLAKMEIRDVAETFSADLEDAGRTVVKDLAKVGVALSLGTLAALALTTGAILAVGRLLGGAFWAGGLIVGLVLLIAAVVFGLSAARDLRDSDSLRMERTRRRLDRDSDVLKDEAEKTSNFVRDEARDFKRHATSEAPGQTH